MISAMRHLFEVVDVVVAEAEDMAAGARAPRETVLPRWHVGIGITEKPYDFLRFSQVPLLHPHHHPRRSSRSAQWSSKLPVS